MRNFKSPLPATDAFGGFQHEEQGIAHFECFLLPPPRFLWLPKRIFSLVPSAGSVIEISRQGLERAGRHFPLTLYSRLLPLRTVASSKLGACESYGRAHDGAHSAVAVSTGAASS